MKSNHFFTACLSMALAATALFTSAAVEAKQCVFNKGGYVLEVQWYRQTDIGRDVSLNEMKALGEPVQSDTLTAGFGSCTKTDEVLTLAAGVVWCDRIKMFNTLADCSTREGFVAMYMPVVHYKEKDRSIVLYDPATHKPSATKIPGSTECINQTLCRGYIKLLKSRSAWLAVPSTTEYLDFWGTAYDVQWGTGGPIK